MVALRRILRALRLSRGKYICFEGSEGVGKTTQVKKVVDHLKSLGYSVLETKEPGTPHSEKTMKLRQLILDKQYDDPNNYQTLLDSLSDIMCEKDFDDVWTYDVPYFLLSSAQQDIENSSKMTTSARELITQAIRSIHLIEVVAPALRKYDYVIQDRGILSGLAYGEASGNDIDIMISLNEVSVEDAKISSNIADCYDQVIVLKGDIANGLKRAQGAKQEFKSGDVMESRGTSFLNKVNDNFDKRSVLFSKVDKVVVDGKSIDEVFSEIKKVLL